MKLLATKSQYLEGLMLPTFSVLQWREVQKSSGLCEVCGAVGGLELTQGWTQG